MNDTSPASPATSAATTASIETVGHLVTFDDKNLNQEALKVTPEEFSKMISPEALPIVPMRALTMADIMDCFRLYFGTNVTMFPFYASRLGAVGIVVVLIGAVLLNLQTQKALHRARYNAVLAELYLKVNNNGKFSSPTFQEQTSPTTTITEGAVSMSCKSELGTSTSFDAGHNKLEVIYSAEAALQRIYSVGVDMSALTTVKEAPELLTCHTGMPHHVSTMTPYFLEDVGTLAKASGVLWPTHWIRQVITGCVGLQFFGACSFVMLLASNVAPILGISNSNSVYVCSCAMGALSLATSYRARTAMAYANNVFIFGGAALLLVASLMHERTEEELSSSLQMFPKSFSQFVIYTPTVISYVAPQVVTIDTETVLADRIYNFHQKDSQASGTSESDPRATALIGSLGVTNMLRRSFLRAMNLGAGISVVVLLFFAEIIMNIFRDNTNAIIALSLSESGLRTAILMILSVGLSACAVLNINPIIGIMDTFVNSLADRSKALNPQVGMFAARFAFFACVAAFLHVVPFFDLVAAVSGALTTPIFVFFVPVAFELQSEMLRAAAESESFSSKGKLSSVLIGWRRMPPRSRVLAVFSVILGTVIMLFSTTMVIIEIIRRRTSDS